MLCQRGAKPGLPKSVIRDQMPEQKWNGLHAAWSEGSPACVSKAFLPFVSFPSMLSSSCSISDNLLTGFSYKRRSSAATKLLPLSQLQQAAQLPVWLTWSHRKSARNKPPWRPELSLHEGRWTIRGSERIGGVQQFPQVKEYCKHLASYLILGHLSCHLICLVGLKKKKKTQENRTVISLNYSDTSTYWTRQVSFPRNTVPSSPNILNQFSIDLQTQYQSGISVEFSPHLSAKTLHNP